ncbi:M23 family metallopeptidase [Streptomyces europaeiscabiei]|uniref:M23 family metallopeptidase n=1 Tax=Streptomyces europaeiscabiei TaxID=146819 RepID=UPI00099C4553|nr:M23 family metallopeptidase [Streptomyces europaeiscabiei]
MRYPLNNVTVVWQGDFGGDPATYAPFGLIGHHGVDLVASVGTPVYAPEDGEIFMSANGVLDQYTGNVVAGETIVLQGGAYEHWLLHLSKRLVAKGASVKQGDLLGYTGATGFVTGPHLHWGVRPLSPNINNGYRGFIDPMALMKGLNTMPNEGWLKAQHRMYFGYPATQEWLDNYMKSGKDVFQITDEMANYALTHGVAFEDFVSAARKSDTTDAELGRQVRDLVDKVAAK